MLDPFFKSLTSCNSNFHSKVQLCLVQASNFVGYQCFPKILINFENSVLEEMRLILRESGHKTLRCINFESLERRVNFFLAPIFRFIGYFCETWYLSNVKIPQKSKGGGIEVLILR